MWIKGRAKLNIAQIRKAYKATYTETGPDLSFEIIAGDTVLKDEDVVGALDNFCDKLVVLVTVKIEPEPTMNQQLPDTPSKSATSHGHPSPALPSRHRQPLQPVNRRLSAPLLQSSDDVQSSKPTLAQRPNSAMPNKYYASSMEDHRQFVSDFNAKLKELEHAEARIPTAHTSPSEADAKGEQVTAGLHLKVEPQSTQGASVKQEHSETQDYKPREYDDPFAVPEDEPEPIMRGQPLRDIVQNTVPERLESAVKASLDVLSQLQAPLEKLEGSQDAQNWIRQIETVRKDASKTRTVVGVVGNTGAGKSSIINAMLDEERLVPTNCMRACTAVVTELSYNDSNVERSRYRAEIEFIGPEDWAKELRVLVEEVFDESGRLVGDARNPDSEAGIAYAKIRAVYHTFTREMLAQATVESLMRVKKVKSILGIPNASQKPVQRSSIADCSNMLTVRRKALKSSTRTETRSPTQSVNSNAGR